MSYKLEFEEISINAPDNRTISAWWIPNQSNKTLLVLHGLRSQKSDEQTLEYIRAFHELGYSIAAIDFRNHGKSGSGDFTFGIDEINDVYVTLDYLYEFKNVTKVGIWGFSYGATTAVFSGTSNNSNPTTAVEIVGIFSDTPYYSLLDMLTTQVARRTPLTLFMADLLKPGILLMTQLLYGFDFNAVEQQYLSGKAIDIPTVVVGCTNDATVPLAQTISVHRILGDKAKFLEFENCNAHGDAYESDPVRYKTELNNHFDQLFAH
ncbi:MAG: hypothetical protein CL793_07975 [Chloroflexi bacterium]|nr:hypothetical protein [Chloroflexota bacterium]